MIREEGSNVALMVPGVCACEVKDFDPRDHMDPKLARRTARATQFAVATAQMALEDAGTCVADGDPTEWAVVMNTGGGPIAAVAEGERILIEKGPGHVSPLFVPSVMPNAVSCLVSIVTGARGPVLTCTQACASGNYALVEAMHILRRGDAEAVIAGGTEAAIAPVAFAGMGRIGLRRRPTDLGHLQAVAAVGQSRLIEAYNRALEPHGRHAAQILLTGDDLNDRTRYLNVRNTLLAAFQYQAIPIINENDTVRVDELERSVGDNDRLAAMVTNLLRAPLLILLSDVEGLYDGHPSRPESRVIPTIETIAMVTVIQEFAFPQNRWTGSRGTRGSGISPNPSSLACRRAAVRMVSAVQISKTSKASVAHQRT